MSLARNQFIEIGDRRLSAVAGTRDTGLRICQPDGVSIHRELAALVRQAGPDVLLDAVEFRAAFDDFVLEGAATEGEVNLLTDAIRLGALRRVLDQISQGADPRIAVESQGIRLAQQRGTQETAGAQWALAVLTFACGELDEPTLLASFPATRESPGAPFAFPAVPPTVAPTAATAATAREETPAPPSAPPSPPASQPPSTTLPPPTVLAPTARPSTTAVAGTSPRRPASPLTVVIRWVAVAAAVGALVTAAVLLLPSGDDPRRSGDTDPSSPPVQTLSTGSLIATEEIDLASPPRAVTLAGRTGGVAVTALGPVVQIGKGEGARVAGPGDRLIGFTLAKGPCQNQRCSAWRRLPLDVLVDGTAQGLPTGGPTFVVAAPTDALVELRFLADGFDQRVSLVDGAPTGQNIEVLTRSDLTGTVSGGPTTIQPTTTTPNINLGADDRRTFNPRRAELFFFADARMPLRPDQAYLRVKANYTKAGEDGEFLTVGDYLNVEGPGGDRYARRNLGTASKPDIVFIVPADFTRGTLVVGGTAPVRDSSAGIAFELTLPRTTFPIRY